MGIYDYMVPRRPDSFKSLGMPGSSFSLRSFCLSKSPSRDGCDGEGLDFGLQCFCSCLLYFRLLSQNRVASARPRVHSVERSSSVGTVDVELDIPISIQG